MADSSSTADAWTRMWWDALRPENWRSPLSGDVNQRIVTPWFSPSLTVNYSGNPAVEQRVVTEVAGYGRQLGWLSEIVSALADGDKPPAETLRRLREAMARIEEIKDETAASAQEQARDALHRLRTESPEAFARLIADEASALGETGAGTDRRTGRKDPVS